MFGFAGSDAVLITVAWYRDRENWLGPANVRRVHDPAIIGHHHRGRIFAPMHASLSHRFATPILIALLCFELLLLAASLPGHPLHIDEAWIGEQTWFLARDGYVHSNLFEGLAHHDERGVVYHRLFVLMGSWMVNLFGWGIGALRLVTVVATAVLLLAMAVYVRRQPGSSTAEMLAALVVLLLIPITFYHAKIYRPEMLMALFGFASYWMLERYGDERRLTDLLAGGFLAGCAMLTHLYGAMFVIAGIYLLARRRQWGGILPFALVAAIPFIPYLADIATHYEIFREQISNPIAAKKTSFTLITPFANLIEEHKRLFRKPEIILVTLLFLLSAIAMWRGADRKGRLFLEYTIALVILLGMASGDKLVTRYAIPLFPFFAIAIAHAATRLPGLLGRSRAYRWAFAALLALFMGYGIWYQIGEVRATGGDETARNRKLALYIPEGARIAGPMNLIFNQIERFHITALYLAAKEQGGTLTPEGAAAFAAAHNAGYIVTNSAMTNEEEIAGLDSVAIGSRVGSFVVMTRTEDFMVLKRAGE
jgi:Dolichyl-phosphate-mannose-protein mannosyltransferase